MMEDISLHVLDIAENSVKSGAKNIRIAIDIDTAADILRLEIADDGKGMSESEVNRAKDPFYTTKEKRRFGLGLSLLDEAAKAAGGSMKITSSVDAGTKVEAAFQLSHIDRKPLGDMAETIITLIAGNPDIEIQYLLVKDKNIFKFGTKKMKALLNGISVQSADGLKFIRNYLREHAIIFS